MNRVFYKVNTKNEIDYLYEIPCTTRFSGMWEKHYSLTEKNCTPMLDCTTDKIVEKILFRFYDNPPYQETKEQEEEYNKILSSVKIIFDNSLQSIEEVHFNNRPITTINEEEFKKLTQDKCLIISSVL